MSASFLGLANNLGEPLTFLAFSLITVVGTIVLYIHLPETKDVSLEQVLNDFCLTCIISILHFFSGGEALHRKTGLWQLLLLKSVNK